MGMKHYAIQLASLRTGRNITDTGGTVYVAVAGSTQKVPLLTKAGATLANPITPTNGLIEFWTADTVATVDLYGQSPTGHGFIHKGDAASGISEIYLDVNTRRTDLIIPFAAADTTATTETDTGFNLPTNAIVSSVGMGVDVAVLQSAKTIDFGVLSTESGGVAAGFCSALSLAAAVTVVPKVTVTAGVWASSTIGSMLQDFTAGTNSDDRGLFDRRELVCDGTAVSISYTLSSGTTTAKGFLKIPMTLPNI